MFGVSGLTSVSTVRRLGAFLSPVEKNKAETAPLNQHETWNVLCGINTLLSLNALAPDKICCFNRV